MESSKATTIRRAATPITQPADIIGDMLNQSGKALQLLDLPNEILSQIVDELLGQARKDVKAKLNSDVENEISAGPGEIRLGDLIASYEKDSTDCVITLKTTLDLQLVNKLFRDIVLSRGKAAEHRGADSLSILDTFRQIVSTQPFHAHEFVAALRQTQKLILEVRSACEAAGFGGSLRDVSAFWLEESHNEVGDLD